MKLFEMILPGQLNLSVWLTTEVLLPVVWIGYEYMTSRNSHGCALWFSACRIVMESAFYLLQEYKKLKTLFEDNIIIIYLLYFLLVK